MASKLGHCRNDLIFRWRMGTLGGDIALAVFNYVDLRRMAEAADLPLVYLLVTPDTKPAAAGGSAGASTASCSTAPAPSYFADAVAASCRSRAEPGRPGQGR